MKIAIHNREGSFSDRWIAYCQKNNIDYKTVNCYDNDIINQVSECDIVMWHFHHRKFKDFLSAKPILFALEHAGVKVFPNFNTAWHFDDKVAQKYLLEAIDAPLVPSYVFYEKKQAVNWIEKTGFPKVFKLKGGAGSHTVKLVHTKTEANALIKKAFGKGFKQFESLVHLKDNYKQYKAGLIDLKTLLRVFGRMIIGKQYSRLKGREKGYIYFQDFVPNNLSDTRIIVIGERAFGIKRLTRERDFRASGSGKIVYKENEIDKRCITTAFKVAKKLNTQNLAFDFVFDKNNCPLIIEISYGYSVTAYDNCPGYWDIHLNWYEGAFLPQEWIIQDLLTSIE